MGSNLCTRKFQTDDNEVKVEVEEVEEVKLMQYKLKELYKQLNIPQAAWMGDRMELPIQQFYVKLKLTSSNQVIRHLEIFKKNETKRILVEGLPGYGKTTLATKIAYDWASNEKYTQRFHLLFLLSIRELRDKSIIDAIVDLVRVSGFEKPEEVLREIAEDENKILLILDGLDEVSSNQRDKILNIIYKREMTRMTVVVTCRSGEFSLNPGEGIALFSGLPIKPEFWDQRVIILGIQNDDKVEFLNKFLHKTESVNKVIEYLKNVTEVTREFFDSPLMLTLLAEMVVKGNQIGPITTRTNFYKDVINFMIRRSQERRNVFLSKSFNVFDEKNSENGSFKFKLRKFGYLCFQRVWNGNQLEFDEDELIKNIHQLSLVIIFKKLTILTSTNYYQIYHRTILEFMAAYYIHQEFLQNNFVSSKLIEHKLIIDALYCGKTSMVTPFLIGLMEENASNYFLMTSKYINLFQLEAYSLVRILMECECLAKIENSLIQNLPSEMDYYEAYTNSSHIYKRLVTLGVQSGRLQKIHINWGKEINLPTDIELPNVHLYGYGNETFEGLKQIKCQRFHWFTFYNEKKINECFELLSQMSAKVHIFDVLNKGTLYFLKKEDKWPVNMEIKELFWDLTDLTVVKEICDILDKCKIHKLVLRSFDITEHSEVLFHCKNTKHLDVDRCQISMDELFNDKQWESITLKNVELTDPAIKDFYVCKSVILDGQTSKSSCTFISKISKISYLKCNYNTLFELMTCFSWQGFQTITEIDLNIYSKVSVFDSEFWKSFHLFRNLESLKIDLNCLTLYLESQTDTSIQKEILEKVLLLPVNELTLHFPRSSDNFILADQLNDIVRKVIVKSVETIFIHNPIELKKDDVLKWIDIIQYCSEKNMSLKNLNLVPYDVDVSIFEINIVSNVNIKYSFSEKNITFLLSIR